jgi:hypothetical protein
MVAMLILAGCGGSADKHESPSEGRAGMRKICLNARVGVDIATGPTVDI